MTATDTAERTYQIPHQGRPVEGGDVEGDASRPAAGPQDAGDGAGSHDAGDVPTGGEPRHTEVGAGAVPALTATNTAERTYVRRVPCCLHKPRITHREPGRVYTCHRCGRHWRVVLNGVWIMWEAAE